MERSDGGAGGLRARHGTSDRERGDSCGVIGGDRGRADGVPARVAALQRGGGRGVREDDLRLQGESKVFVSYQYFFSPWCCSVFVCVFFVRG